MKKIVIIAKIFVLLSINGFSQQAKKFNDLIGTWEIAGEGNEGARLEIIDSANAYLTYMGERKRIFDFKADFTKTPIWLDFTTNDTSTTIRIKSIVEISGENVMKWQLFIDEDRVPYFTSTKGELLYLKKSKKESIVTARTQ